MGGNRADPTGGVVGDLSALASEALAAVLAREQTHIIYA